MKNLFVLCIISSFYLQISAMELAIPSMDQTSFLEALYSTPKKFDWISEERQELIIKSLIILQQSPKSNNDDVSRRIVYQLFTLHTQDEYKELEKICPVRIDNQKFNIEQMALMPYNDRKQLINLIRPTIFSQIIKGTENTMILERDYNELSEILPDDMKNNLELKIVPYNCFYRCLPITVGSLIFLTGCAFGIAGIITSRAVCAIPSLGLIIAGPATAIVYQITINKYMMVNSQEYNKLLADV